MISFVDVEEARERIKDQTYLSPFPHSETVSQLTGNQIFFKLENLQLTGSFKERGALNRLLTLTPEESKRGVIAASAGNHGMAVAYHSRRLNIGSTIVMPTSAPLISGSSGSDRTSEAAASALGHDAPPANGGCPDNGTG